MKTRLAIAGLVLSVLSASAYADNPVVERTDVQRKDGGVSRVETHRDGTTVTDRGPGNGGRQTGRDVDNHKGHVAAEKEGGGRVIRTEKVKDDE